LHFWKVAMVMVAVNPLGVGPRNFDANYHRYDFLLGKFGFNRSVHSSHFQVLAEFGYAAAAIWISMFAYAIWIGVRTRRFSKKAPGLSDDERYFYFTTSNALLASMAAFLVGGSFIALALNDLTWYTFAAVAAVDRLAARHVAVPAQVPSAPPMVEAYERRAARA
jgi:putative inorganic carbon (HCO3(-)) transporter